MLVSFVFFLFVVEFLSLRLMKKKTKPYQTKNFDQISDKSERKKNFFVDFFLISMQNKTNLNYFFFSRYSSFSLSIV